jgi:hypothetical protein
MSVWRNGLAAVALAAALAACGEEVIAPGSCPDLCPSEDVGLSDTTLTGIVTSDSSFRGFVRAHEGGILVLSTVDTNEAVAGARFHPRQNFWFGTSLLDTFFIDTIDSLTLTVRVLQRDTAVTGTRLMIYRAPRSLDTTATFDTLNQYVTGARLIDSIILDSTALGDSLTTGLISHNLNPALLEPDTVDSGVVALVFALRADTTTFVTLSSSEFAGGPRLQWAVRAADTTRKNVFAVSAAYDGFGQELVLPEVTTASVFVGGIPSARALLRLTIPRYFVDSTTIVRATLMLTPRRAVSGRPAEEFTLEARGIVRDFGSKSFFTPEEALYGAVRVTAGDTGQIALDVTRILRTWRGIDPDTLPRTLLLRVGEEGGTPGDLELARRGSAQAPYLVLTYIKPYTFGLP